MSRIAKKPIPVPKGVEVAINGAVLSIKGAKGRMELAVHEDVEVVNEDNVLKFAPRTQAQSAIVACVFRPQLPNNHVRSPIARPQSKTIAAL